MLRLYSEWQRSFKNRYARHKLALIELFHMCARSYIQIVVDKQVRNALFNRVAHGMFRFRGMRARGLTIQVGIDTNRPVTFSTFFPSLLNRSSELIFKWKSLAE